MSGNSPTEKVRFDRTGFNEDVGLRLQFSRKSRGITQAVMAKAIGLSRANYASIESGRQRVSVDVLWRACCVMQISIASLVPPPVPRPRGQKLWSTMNTAWVDLTNAPKNST